MIFLNLHFKLISVQYAPQTAMGAYINEFSTFQLLLTFKQATEISVAVVNIPKPSPESLRRQEWRQQITTHPHATCAHQAHHSTPMEPAISLKVANSDIMRTSGTYLCTHITPWLSNQLFDHKHQLSESSAFEWRVQDHLRTQIEVAKAEKPQKVHIALKPQCTLIWPTRAKLLFSRDLPSRGLRTK